MTLFCRGFSFELVTRVFDIFLLENHYKIVYRVSLAILKVKPTTTVTYSNPNPNLTTTTPLY